MCPCRLCLSRLIKLFTFLSPASMIRRLAHLSLTWKVMLTAVTTDVGIMMLASQNRVERDQTRLIYSLVVPHNYARPAQAT